MLGQEALDLAVIEEEGYQRFLARQEERMRAMRMKADHPQRIVDCESEGSERGQDMGAMIVQDLVDAQTREGTMRSELMRDARKVYKDREKLFMGL